MISTITTLEVRQALTTNSSTAFYNKYFGILGEFVKKYKNSKNLESEILDDLVDILCNVVNNGDLCNQMHEIIVLINSILNIRGQLVQKMISQKNTILKVISYFKDCYYRFEIEKEEAKKSFCKINFQLYSILHLITTILNFHSKNKKNQKISIFQNKSLISTILNIDLELLTKSESIHLFSILITLLVKNTDLAKYASKIKTLILENIKFVKQTKSRKNFTQSFRKIISFIKLQENQILKNGILEWIMAILKQNQPHQISDVIELFIILTNKFPNLKNKCIPMGFIQITKGFFKTHTYMSSVLLQNFVDFIDSKTKQQLHSFVLSNLVQNYKSSLSLLNKLITQCSAQELIQQVANGLLDRIKGIFERQQNILLIHQLFQYLQNFIIRFKSQNTNICQCFIDKIKVELTLDCFQSTINVEILKILSKLRSKYLI